MRVQHFSTLDYLPEALRDFLRRRFAEIFGIGLLVFTGALAVALVTWSAHDPSFNHAVDGPVRNLLGHPGAGHLRQLLRSGRCLEDQGRERRADSRHHRDLEGVHQVEGRAHPPGDPGAGRDDPVAGFAQSGADHEFGRFRGHDLVLLESRLPPASAVSATRAGGRRAHPGG
ncbi:MAG: DNA translocase FtsK 4TM domain-containing protein [Acidobacteria bacterium]|nr:DNA translocase FtsK 4TM domain-containing protein [Acidobacteriota bacterium]